MAEAINKDDRPAMIAAVVAMTVMIVAVDQLFWRPIVVWSERFKLEDTADSLKPKSWFLDLLERSRLAEWLMSRRQRAAKRLHLTKPTFIGREKLPALEKIPWRPILRWGVAAASVVLVLWGAWTVMALMLRLPLHNATTGEDWLHVVLSVGATFLRTTAAVLIGGLWALPMGILIGLSPKWSQRLQPGSAGRREFSSRRCSSRSSCCC